ncbi:DNA polymerase epsilon subunit 3-like [Ptychodera flava]|uniref:DNA polymerase epsilon subunit 3-like n=1 Tax=Ptychodera flava TaxID=63121 RepID=UPI00396A07DF
MAERPEDLNLPNSVVARIVKEAVPDGVNVSKEARSAISRAASVFVLYATACANNFALKGKRKTLTGADVLSALEEMEFGYFVEPLKESLETFKKDQKDKKEATEKKKKVKADTQKSQTGNDKGEDESDNDKEDADESKDDDEEEEMDDVVVIKDDD